MMQHESVEEEEDDDDDDDDDEEGVLFVSKNDLSKEALRVADVTMILKSPCAPAAPFRRTKIFLSRPRSTSLCKERSCASSTITTEYLLSKGSVSVSRSRRPSVTYLMAVFGPHLESKRTP